MIGAAKRLTFSLLAASALAGCAVYEPYNPNGGTFASYGAEPYGQPVDSSPPAYSAPINVKPPLFFNFGFESGGAHRDEGFRGGERHGRRDG